MKDGRDHTNTVSAPPAALATTHENHRCKARLGGVRYHEVHAQHDKHDAARREDVFLLGFLRETLEAEEAEQTETQDTA